MKPCLLVILLMGLACASTKPITSDPDIWQRPSGGSSADETPIPGPIKDFGPFDTFGDALKAACPRFLSKPNATLFHLLNNEKNPSVEEKAKRRMLLRTATEYCAWLYYTPERKYKMSMISNLEESGDDLLGTTTCYLPKDVEDPDHPPDSIKYIFSIHNHPFAGGISDKDIFLASAMANAHKVVEEINNKPVPYAVIAFFSRSTDGENPTCDGFYQYIPGTGELLRWTHSMGHWSRATIGTVVWTSPTNFTVEGQRE